MFCLLTLLFVSTQAANYYLFTSETHKYLLFNKPGAAKTFKQASASCTAWHQKAPLASITSPSENALVTNRLKNADLTANFWFGLYFRVKKQTPVWMDGTEF